MRCFMVALGLLLTFPIPATTHAAPREQLIPILGVTAEQEPSGSVTYLTATFEERADRTGLRLRFHERPGRFTRMAQTSAERAIRQAAASLGLSTDSWTVELKVPYEGVTIGGDSLSAMVGITIAAMAQGKTVQTGHVLTGTLNADGEIGPVGEVSLKVQAARFAKLRRVLVPHQQATVEKEESQPTHVEIMPIRSVPDALDALTNSVMAR